jgi:hypothetical protein
MANVYNRGKLVMTDGTVDWDGATALGVILVTSTYVYNADHNFVSDLTNELAGGGYARQTLAGRTQVEDDVNDRIEFDATDTTFPTLGAAAGNPAHAIVYDNTTGLDTTRDLICMVTLTAPPVPNGGDYTIQWDATGVLTLGE